MFTAVFVLLFAAIERGYCACRIEDIKIKDNCYNIQNTVDVSWVQAHETCKLSSSELLTLDSVEEKNITELLLQSFPYKSFFTSAKSTNYPPILWSVSNKPVENTIYGITFVPNKCLVTRNIGLKHSYAMIGCYETASFICKYDADPCHSNPCGKHATCSSHGADGSFKCACDDGYHGDGNVCKAGFKVVCEDHQMTIITQKEFFHNTSFTLADKSCNFIKASSYSYITISYNQCRTAWFKTDSSVVYKNIVRSHLDHDVITNSDLIHEFTGGNLLREFVVACEMRYELIAEENQTTELKPQQVNVSQNYPELGRFSVNMAVYSSNNFSETAYQGTRYPLLFKVRDHVYIELSLDSTNEAIKLTPQACYATPTNNPNDVIQHFVIRDRCFDDPSYKQYLESKTKFQFSFDAFHFNAGNEVYIHCKVLVCTDLAFSAEFSFGCSREDKNLLRKETSLDVTKEKSQIYLMSRQVVVIINSKNESTDKGGVEEISSKIKGCHMSIIYIMIGVIFVLVVSSIIFIIVWSKLMKKQLKSQKKSFAIPRAAAHWNKVAFEIMAY